MSEGRYDLFKLCNKEIEIQRRNKTPTVINDKLF